MLDDSAITDDWTKNWQVSIAVKITSVVMWALIVMVFLTAVFSLQDLDQQIHQSYESNADLLAYELTNSLVDQRGLSEDSWATVVQHGIERHGFVGAQLVTGDTRLVIGAIDNGVAPDVRRLPAVDGNIEGTLYLYHPDPMQEAETQRNQLVLGILAVLLLFGAFLVIAIRTILHKPLQVLVNATKAISEGDHTIRLDMKRDDEFGALGRFFNEMLDKLIDNQNDLKAALETANSASRSKSAFLANMSHELRTPMNAIIAFSEILEEDARAEGRKEVADDLNKVLSSARHLLNLINGVLDLSKIEAGKVETDITCFNVTSLVDEVAATMTPIMKQNGNQLAIYCDASVGLIQADEIKLRQTLLNLLGNAAKFTKQGMISLAVHRYQTSGDDWIRFIVKDNGIGIATQHQQHLFKEFNQGDMSTTRRYGGTGLGLAISKRFCQMMDGDISVKSQEGVGSVFIVSLPVQQIETDNETVLEKVCLVGGAVQ